jgi:ornithine cyclodeaminase/alanine dehydrogenase-like protein (mu-crystallin family)
VAPTGPAPVRLLTRSEVRSLLRWPELIAAAEHALVRLAIGDDVTASSSQVLVPGAALHLKSGALLDPAVLSVKANLRPDAGSSAGLVLAFDPVRHTLRAVLDSADITAMRTAAVAAVAARQLTGPAGHSLPSVAVIGVGPVGSGSLAALRQVLAVGEVLLWSRDQDRAERAAAELSGPVRVCQSAAEAASQAQIVITATPARAPVLRAGCIAEGAVVLAMGADSPGKRELADGVLDDAAIVVDVAADAFTVGECAYLAGGAAEHRHAELGRLLAGQASLPQDVRHIVFDSVGSAVVDAAATALVLALAEQEEAGQLFTFAR